MDRASDAGESEATGPHGPGSEGLSPAESLRYARHLVLKGVGEQGQLRLRAAKVLLVGAGGLGSPAALYLTAAGIGTLGLVEFDQVDLTNLQRQIIHGTQDVGRAKMDSALDRLREINPTVELVPHPVRLSRENARDLVRGYDLVIDGSDNFPTRYLVNDACVLEGKPFVYGAVLQWEGQVSLFGAPGGPCYRCLFAEPPAAALVQNCAEAGVFGALPGIVGSTQALEALKYLIGTGESLAGRLLILDALEMRWREMALRPSPDCPICGPEATITELIDYEVFCGVRADGTPIDSPESEAVDAISATELQLALASENPPALIDVREAWEWRIANLSDLGARHIPLEALPRAQDGLPERDIVLVCSVGTRSHAAALALIAGGRPRVSHLAGGLRSWKSEIDPGFELA